MNYHEDHEDIPNYWKKDDAVAIVSSFVTFVVASVFCAQSISSSTSSGPGRLRG